MLSNLYEHRTSDLGRLGRGGTKTNPLVGAVFVRNGQIITEGYHQDWGGPHAEAAAINQVNRDELSLCELYVTLEPCSHFGKTAPCSVLVIDSKISKVAIGQKDPNPVVNGRGIKMLRNAGVEVTHFQDSQSSKELLRPFLVNQEQERPYIILKWAESIDGYLSKHDQQIKLTNPISDRLVHKWRSEIDAIIVGTNTVLVDDPSLTTRLYPGSNPVRVIVDRNGRIPTSATVFDDQAPTWRCTLITTPRIKRVEDITISTKENQLLALMRQLFFRNTGVLMVEGGGQLLDSFLQTDLWDECRIFQTKHMLESGIPAPKLPIQPCASYAVLSDKLLLYKKYS
ncbi:MAG: bifunctional diaminohydroxyphosphoribosylaminopyrimidine deaminase/5-amino-6-(5-phosphoribosylamino)uracil reductase RibD [Saprospiraceae bacterium]|nr:bifunctional diaminohydroxyphosphoribosylaminopyrimidine deaminase/5-amino-6-(5-phosphoribosylamino)uracil reductase RibD [Saprospiraceae bacterium]